MRIVFLLIAVFTFFKVNGQTEYEIKTTGKYFYSWGIEYDREAALETARIGLLDTIFVSLLKESAIDRTDTVFIKIIDYFEQKVGLKWEVIAFAEKSDITVKLEQRKQLKVIPVIIGNQSNPMNNNNRVTVDKVNEKVETQGSLNEISKTKSDISNTGDPVLDDLLTVHDAGYLEQRLRTLKSELKLNYGTKGNYPDDSGCYIFVIDQSTKQVVAIYDKGKTSRKNFLTNTIETDYRDKYVGNYFVYVVINQNLIK